MRIQSTDIIAGQPVLAVRKLMQHGRRHGPTTAGNSLATIIETLEVDAPTAKAIFQQLCEEGFIEPTSEQAPSEKDDTFWWYTTIKGNALAMATTRKPITRQTADRIIAQFLERVQQVNAGAYAYRVKQAIIFGSYLSDSPTLGDVDIAIELEDRYFDPTSRKEGHDARIAAAEAEGRQFRDYMDMLLWPEREVFLLLKNRSPTLSLHNEQIEHILQKPLPSKILFSVDSPVPTGLQNETHER